MKNLRKEWVLYLVYNSLFNCIILCTWLFMYFKEFLEFVFRLLRKSHMLGYW
jgi:hypothetical protein